MDENALKAGGFVKLRHEDQWALRVKVPFGETDAASLLALANIAEKFGDGQVHLTVRQSIELRGVRVEQFPEIQAALEEDGFRPGVSGARVRATVACPGAAICKRGLQDTYELARALDERLYARDGLPHKFKTAVSGCPSSCAKPQANDMGFLGAIEPVFDEVAGDCIGCGVCATACPAGAIALDDDGRPVIDYTLCDRDGACITACPTGAIGVHKRGWRVFLGGNFGRRPALAYEIGGVVSTEEAVAMAERALGAFVKHAKGRERVRVVVDRVGLDEFLKEVL